MALQQVFLSLVLCLLSLGTLPMGASRMRIRKSWNAMESKEKQLYLNAVQMALESGKQALFTLVHMNDPRMHGLAHGTCGFMLWHRRFILGYENMLRSLKPEFENITLPYWNYFEDFAKRSSNANPCNTIESCSTFLTEMGGSSGPLDQMTIHGLTVYGNCVSRSVGKYTCENIDPSHGCKNCIIRGNWRRENSSLGTIPHNVVSILNQVSQASDNQYNLLTRLVETSFHNSVHGFLLGAIEGFTSPIDPVFYGHHSMVDLVHYLYYKCYAKGEVTSESKQTASTVFGHCTATTNGMNPISHTSAIRLMVDEITTVENHQELRKHFGSPRLFYEMADTEDLGKDSYVYEVDAFLKSILVQSGLKCPSLLQEKSSSRTSTTKNFDGNNDADGVLNTLNSCGKEVRDLSQKTYGKKFKDSEINDDVIHKQEMIECLAYEKQNGGKLPDFGDGFRKAMKISSSQKPYCFSVLGKRRRKAGRPSFMKSFSKGGKCAKDLSLNLGMNIN